MFFLSCGVLIVTLEDMAKQLLFLILGDADTSDIKLFVNEEAVEAKLKKGISGGNTKLSN